MREDEKKKKRKGRRQERKERDEEPVRSVGTLFVDYDMTSRSPVAYSAPNKEKKGHHKDTD